MLEEKYLELAEKQFCQYKNLGEKAMIQLDPVQLFHVNNENSNSIAVIVKHLHGNMLSRWTNFLTADGEKPGRDRNGEFENDIKDETNLQLLWDEGWRCLFSALSTLKPGNLGEIIYIRQEPHTVLEAINRQIAHYSYHIGQIVFAAKALKDAGWQNLSIPKKIK
ncbi:MAG: DUF1572 family protein [Ferruginibacter sp.]